MWTKTLKRCADAFVEEFALLEAGYTIVRLLQTFDRIERAAEMRTPERQTVTLVVANADGCKVVLRRTSDEG